MHTRALKKLARFAGILSLWLAGGFMATAQETTETPEIILRLELPFPDLDPLTIFIAHPRQLSANGHPAIIYFTGGDQREKYAKDSMYLHLSEEAVKRGYIFIAPAAPCRGCTFSYGGGERYFPALFELLSKQLPVKDGKFQLMGFSNGGRSSLYLASLYPDWVAGITTFPGALENPSKEALASLAGLCISMHVGRKDRPFMRKQRKLVKRLKKIDRKIHAVEYPKQQHWIEKLDTALSANKLLDNIESGVGCPQ